MNPEPVVDAMRNAARALTVGEVREKLHAVQSVQDALDAAKAVLLAELEVQVEVRTGSKSRHRHE